LSALQLSQDRYYSDNDLANSDRLLQGRTVHELLDRFIDAAQQLAADDFPVKGRYYSGWGDDGGSTEVTRVQPDFGWCLYLTPPDAYHDYELSHALGELQLNQRVRRDEKVMFAELWLGKDSQWSVRIERRGGANEDRLRWSRIGVNMDGLPIRVFPALVRSMSNRLNQGSPSAAE
jgi:hypothetical protein